MTMPSMENRGFAMPFATFRRSVLGIRNDKVHSMESNRYPVSQNTEFESFQTQVFKRFRDLSASNAEEFLSLDWISKLLDAFVDCQEEFSLILCNNKVHLSKPPLDKMVLDYFERSIKALDMCNATRDGIDRIRLWQKHLDIVLSALGSQHKILSEGMFRRARKALMDLALVMLDDKCSGSLLSNMHRSFGRNKSKDQHHQLPGHSRSLSWSVSNSWSATKQLQAIASTLVSPRAHEISATNGLAIPVFTMSFVLMFVLWVLIAAIPCQDRSLQIHFPIPRQFIWSTPIYLIHVRITDESKKRRNSIGLLKEIYQLENSVRHITDLLDCAHFPLTVEQKEEVKKGVEELSLVCEVWRSGIDPLERHLREVFRNIMSSRTEGLALLGKEK